MALKPVTFHGDSLDRLRDFPQDARREAGYELHQVQKGANPTDWKPMPTVGVAVREIRIRAASGAYRAITLPLLPTPFMCCTPSTRKAKRRRCVIWILRRLD